MMGAYDTTIGALMVGIFFNTFLYGLVIYQFAAYHRTKFDDCPAIKYMVFFLFVLDTFHSASAIYMAWHYTVTNYGYGYPAALAAGTWPYKTTPVCTALAALMTQTYSGFRIWRFTGSNILYGVVILTVVPSFVLGVACSVEAYTFNSMSELPRITPLAIAWLSMQVIVDTFITITLTIVFTRSRTGIRKTDTVLNRLTRGAIQTGLFSGIFAMSDLVTFIVLPNTSLYGMFAIPLGRIYTNTFMDSLLSRESYKATMFGTGETSGSGSIGWAPADSPCATVEISSSGIQPAVRIAAACDHSFCGGVQGKHLPLPV